MTSFFKIKKYILKVYIEDTKILIIIGGSYFFFLLVS